jgi:hypothetical protein
VLKSTISEETVTVGRRIEYTAGDFIGTEGLIFIEEASPHVKPSGVKSRKARFLCICGNAFDTLIESVVAGLTGSCGCVRKEVTRSRGKSNKGRVAHNYVDGRTLHYLYGTWCQMVRRCSDEKSKSYQWYGARGVSVCDQWKDPNAFFEFCDTVLGKRPDGFTLDRINPYGNYEPSNVRWADAKLQSENQRRF